MANSLQTITDTDLRCKSTKCNDTVQWMCHDQVPHVVNISQPLLSWMIELWNFFGMGIPEKCTGKQPNNGVFHYKPSISRHPYFWKHPYQIKQLCFFPPSNFSKIQSCTGCAGGLWWPQVWLPSRFQEVRNVETKISRICMSGSWRLQRFEVLIWDSVIHCKQKGPDNLRVVSVL